MNPTDMNAARIKRGRNHPPHIHQVCDYDCRGHAHQEARTSLGLPGKKKEKGTEKVKKKEEDHHPAPAAADAMQIPDNFMRQIARPDHDQLPKSQIGPHHGHREQKAPEMMKIFVPDDFRKSTARHEPGEQNDDKG